MMVGSGKTEVSTIDLLSKMEVDLSKIEVGLKQDTYTLMML
ncbi:hypothetical protein Slin_6660 (plasmid) [Spirosoma linguale DSM 74]|uniref:Uncharacterized protein n=1 Tax=Spirosoma linguale (strain ATCC 33905 / DSM 74 / LMG 10896 / Claus 1) TaxID=504472 RepID=D2QUY5_SPILD|nr:hypothetical protein Slin_6660 [Spirosoma linguale DSM 74]